MADTQHAQLESTIEIDAPPAQVWALVTDLAAMSARSPQVVRTTVKGGAVAQGVKFSNLNRKGLLFWPTKGKVVRFTPHEDFAFRIAENKTIWSFQLTPTATGGTTVTHRRETPDGISGISLNLTKYVLGGVPKFTDELRTGMAATLAALKKDAEAARAA